MRTFERSTVGLTADDDGIALDQTTGGAADLILNGVSVAAGVADFSAQPRRVGVKSGGDVSAVVFTIYGTDRAGSSITDTVTGVNNTTVTTNKVFRTVTRIAASAAVGTNTRVGFSAEAISAWIMLGSRRRDYQAAYSLAVTGTVSVEIEQTFINLNRQNVQGEFPSDLTSFKTGKTASENGAITPIPAFVRLKQNSGAGSCVLRVVPTVTD